MKSPSRSVITEGIVIVVSILLAFALDSWWDEQSEHRAFVRELTNVLEEFQANDAEMEVWRNAHERVATSSAALVDLLLSRSSDVVSVTDTLVIGPLLYPTVDPSLGGLRTLLQSGRLALVEDADLRLALASWEDVLEDLREEELVGKEVTIDRIWPVLLLGQDPDVAKHLVDLHDEFWRQPDREHAMVSSQIMLRVSDALVSTLIVKQSVARQTIDEFDPILVLADEVIAQIRTELRLQP